MTNPHDSLSPEVRLQGLRGLRRAAGLTQERLGHIVGLSMSMISQLEHGTKGTSIASAVRLAQALGCSLEQLLGDDHGMPEPLAEFLARLAPPDITEREIQVLRAIRIPGHRITARAYNNLYDAVRNSEKMHS